MRFSWTLLLPLAACSGEDLARLSAAPAAEAPSGDGLVELRHTVDLRVARGELRLAVTRSYRNDGPDVRELERDLALPEGAVAGGLRVQVGRQWQGAALLGADAAQARWFALQERGDAAPQPMALLEWLTDDQVRLRYWPLEPGATATVEYELAAPPRYQGGAWWLDYPHEPREALAAVPEFVGPARLAGSGVDLEELRGEEGEGEAAPVTATRLRVVRPDFGPLAARWAARDFGGENTYWGLELDVAARLGEAPRRPHVVFAVDASWTQGDDGVALQRALLEGFLQEAPDAEVEVVVYRRFAARLFGRFVPAAEVAGALAALPREALAPANGSNLDAAAALAAQALAGTSGPARLVLFTDERTRAELDAPRLSAALAGLTSEVVVHVVDARHRRGLELGEGRVRDARFSDTAEAHGGVELAISGHPSGALQARSAMRGLVRPIRLDALEVEADGLELDVPETLEEGDGRRLLGFAPRAPRTVTVRGLLWAQRLEQVLTLDGDFVERLAALSLGTPNLRDALSDPETLAAAQAARAVSSMTSYLSTAPDARASVLGSDGHFGLSGWGSGCSGCLGTWGSSSRCGGVWAVPTQLIRPLVEAAARGCGARTAEVQLEVTLDEVVGVTARTQDAATDTCVAEAVWALRLPVSLGEGPVTLDLRLD